MTSKRKSKRSSLLYFGGREEIRMKRKMFGLGMSLALGWYTGDFIFSVVMKTMLKVISTYEEKKDGEDNG